MSKPASELHCPACGYCCSGKGGFGCIDKPTLVAIERIKGASKPAPTADTDASVDQYDELDQQIIDALAVDTRVNWSYDQRVAVRKVIDTATAAAVQAEREAVLDEIKVLQHTDYDSGNNKFVEDDDYNDALSDVRTIITNRMKPKS